MSKEKEASMFEKSPEFCAETGKHHKWKLKMHGKKAFPTECVDCGIKAETLLGDIDKLQEEAVEQARIAEEKQKAIEEEERLEIPSRKLEIPRKHLMQNRFYKGRNVKDLTEGEEIKKRWQEYKEELYKKVLMNQIVTMVWSLT